MTIPPLPRCFAPGFAVQALLFGLTVAPLAACGRSDRPRAAQIFADSTAAALAEAAAAGDRLRIRRLIGAGADPNAQGDDGVTLLQWALLNRSKAGLDELLAGRADPARADSSGTTVLHYAAMANDPEYLDILLARGADPDTPDAVTGATPLVSALMGNREVQFQKLLAAGAKPDLPDRLGNSSLHVAAKINAYRRVLDLLKSGADPRARNQQGATFQRYLVMTKPEMLTAEARREREAIARWLEAHGVAVESPT
jgi:hypothetical protein